MPGQEAALKAGVALLSTVVTLELLSGAFAQPAGSAVPVTADNFPRAESAKGYFEPNRRSAYTLNNITAKPNGDGSITIQFGGCEGKIANCLPTTPGWDYLVRLYRPREDVLDGTWIFPKPVVLN